MPYEESSIYADVNYHSDQRFQDPIPPPTMDIVLEAGDFLFVPKHWWHFVETTRFVCLEYKTLYLLV